VRTEGDREEWLAYFLEGATTKPTATKAVDSLCEAGILVETSGRRRDRVFSYGAYMDLLKVGTEIGG
jgi:hypothetical protein